MNSKIREKQSASFIVKPPSDNEIVHAFYGFIWVLTSLQNFIFAPKFNSLGSVLMPCVGIISLHFKFISGLTNVLLKSFIWKKVNI